MVCPVCLLDKKLNSTPCLDTDICIDCWNLVNTHHSYLFGTYCPLCLSKISDWRVAHRKRITAPEPLVMQDGKLL